MPTLAELQNQRNQFFKQKGEQQQGQIAGETQGNVEALQRRFTSMGGAGTGAALAAEQKARDAGLSQQRAASSDLAGQQLQLGESDIARQFQSEQTQQGQGFAAEQARLAREAQTGESALGRQFAAEQARLGIEAQTGESARGRTFTGEQAELQRKASLGDAEAARQLQERLAGKDIEFKRELAKTEQGNKMQEMDLAYQQFLIDKDTTAFNKRLAAIAAGVPIETVATPSKQMTPNSLSSADEATNTLINTKKDEEAAVKQALANLPKFRR
jgi:hypothetical protein